MEITRKRKKKGHILNSICACNSSSSNSKNLKGFARSLWRPINNRRIKKVVYYNDYYNVVQ